MLRFGIIGAGNIAHRFAKALQAEEKAELYAISGRSQEKLEAFAQEYPCEKLYVGYDALLQDEKVDCVYIALPHRMHAEWMEKAIRAKKHVLVEKPAVLNEEEALHIAQAAKENQVVVMEAMKNRFTPAYQKAQELYQEGVLGTLQSVETHHGFQLPPEAYGKTYHTTGVDAGCLYDIGCYGIGFLLDYVEGEPKVIKTYTNMYQKAEVYLKTQLQFPHVEAVVECAFDRNLEAYGKMCGTKGTMCVKPLHRPDTIVLETEKGTETFSFPLEVDDFYPEIHAFVQAIETNQTQVTAMTWEDSIYASHIADCVRKSFTQYEESDLEILAEQEKCFALQTEFTSEEAFRLGTHIVSLLPQYDRGISLQIVRESDGLTIFQYVSDDKKQSNLQYAAGKRNAILAFGHSSAYLNILCKVHPDTNWKEKNALPSGGAFPLFNQEGTLIASVLVSGLHEGKDHEIILRGLSLTYKKQPVAFSKAIG